MAGAVVPARNAAAVGAAMYGAFANRYGCPAGRAGGDAAYPYDGAEFYLGSDPIQPVPGK